MFKGVVFKISLNIKNYQKLNIQQISAICTKWTCIML